MRKIMIITPSSFVFSGVLRATAAGTRTGRTWTEGTSGLWAQTDRCQRCKEELTKARKTLAAALLSDTD